MNVIAQIPRSPAETALIDRYVERLGDLPGHPEVSRARDAAVEALKADGLPTRRVESWHYTDLKSLLRNLPPSGETPQRLAPVIEGALVLSVVDGVAEKATGAEGMAATRYAEALMQAGAAKRLTPFGRDDAIGRINAALVSDGLSLSVEGAPDKPVEIQLRSGGEAHARIVADFAANAKATIIERHAGEGFATTVCDLALGDGADIVWVLLQERSDKAVHLGQLNAALGKDAKLNLFIVNEGGKLVRQEVHARAAGEGAEFRLRGVDLLAGDSHVDVTMTLSHDVPHTASTAVVRNIVTGRANGAFQGMIKVARPAQKTDARMACNTLLLSDEGGFSAKPELEIFADDVACGHGATVTEIDRNHLFYLMARGVPERDARGLLVKAFVAEIIEELEDESLVEALEHRLDRWSSAHG